MTRPSNADLREAIRELPITITIKSSDLKRYLSYDTIDAIIDLFQAHQQQLLTELLGELPRSYKDKVGLDVAQLWDSADATDGYNQALQDVVSVIERYREGL